MTTTTTEEYDPRELSLSEVPDELLSAFGPIEQGVILFCKITTGKTTMEKLEKRYRHGNACVTSNSKKGSI